MHPLPAGARRGLLLRGGGDVLERLAHVDTVVLDKTGTLTKGRLQLVGVRGAGGSDVPAPPGEAVEVLRLAAAAESTTRHPLADAVLAAAQAQGGWRGWQGGGWMVVALAEWGRRGERVLSAWLRLKTSAQIEVADVLRARHGGPPPFAQVQPSAARRLAAQARQCSLSPLWCGMAPHAASLLGPLPRLQAWRSPPLPPPALCPAMA